MTKLTALAGLAIFAGWTWPSSAHAQPVTTIQATCRTPQVEDRIAFLGREIAYREPQDEQRRKLITTMMDKGYPISTNSTLYKQAYDYLQGSMRLRRELDYLEGLPPCPQPAATTTTVTTVGPAPQVPPVNPWAAPTTITPPQGTPQVPSAGQPAAPQYQVYNPFYYVPGTGAYNAPPGFYNPTGPGAYNSPLSVYNAPVAPPPPPVVTPLDTLGAAFGIYNAPWEGGGFYFGPTGSASFLQDADLIKRFEPRTIDSLVTMPRSITGSSTAWRSGSDSLGWVSSTNPLRTDSDRSKTRILSSSIGYDVGARAGYQIGNIRLEGEFDYAHNSADTLENPRRLEMRTDLFRREDTLHGSTTGMTFLFNGIYDFNVPALSGFGVTPHVLGGIGVGRTSLDLKWGDRTIVNSSDWNFAYQVGAGLRYQLTPAVSLDLDYRYRGITDVTLHNEFEKISVPYNSHNFLASLTYKLPWGPASVPPLWTPPPPVTPYTPAPAVTPTYPLSPRF